jgi:hypothetical protein
MANSSAAASIGSDPPFDLACAGQRCPGTADLDVVLVLGDLDAALDGARLVRHAATSLQPGARLAVVGFTVAGDGFHADLARIRDDQHDAALLDGDWTAWEDALREVFDLLVGDPAYWKEPYRPEGRRTAVLLVGPDPDPGRDAAWSRQPEAAIRALMSERGWRVLSVGTGPAASEAAVLRACGTGIAELGGPDRPCDAGAAPGLSPPVPPGGS